MKAKGVGEASRWLHFGLTSNDVVDTAQALQIKESAELILAAVQGLEDALKLRAFEFRTPSPSAALMASTPSDHLRTQVGHLL